MQTEELYFLWTKNFKIEILGYLQLNWKKKSLLTVDRVEPPRSASQQRVEGERDVCICIWHVNRSRTPQGFIAIVVASSTPLGFSNPISYQLKWREIEKNKSPTRNRRWNDECLTRKGVGFAWAAGLMIKRIDLLSYAWKGHSRSPAAVPLPIPFHL